MKLKLLHESSTITDLNQIINTYGNKKSAGGVNRELLNLTDDPPSVRQPSRSGNLELPTGHKILGQSDNPHGTIADKPGIEPSITGSNRTVGMPTNIDNKGILDSTKKTRPSKVTDSDKPFSQDSPYGLHLQGPSETPGKSKENTLGIGINKLGLQKYIG